MATRTCRKTHDVEQTQKVIPLISRETSFGQNVSKLVLGVNIFDLDFRIQVDPIKQPIKSDTVSSRHMSQSGTSSFNYNLDHGFVVFTDVQLRFPLGRTRVGGYAVQFVQLINPLFSIDTFGLGSGIIELGWTYSSFPELLWPGWMLSLVVRITLITNVPQVKSR